MSREERENETAFARSQKRRAAVAAAFLAAVGGTAGLASAQESPAVATQSPVVVLEADSLKRENDGQVIVAEGSVEARYEGRTLRASRLVYDLEKKTVRAQGGVEILDADGSIQYAEEIELDERLNAGVATGFAARFATGGVVAANTMIRNGDGSSALDRVIYTACPVCADPSKPGPTWTLQARRAIQNPASKMIEYRGATLKFGPAPVLYAPYFSHPDPTAGRRSGLLTPDAGQNRRLGAQVEIPYYFAISESQDLTVTPQIFSKVNPILKSRYRKRFWSGQVQLDPVVGWDQDFDDKGKFGDETFRGSIFGTGNFEINDYWRWGFGVERASDDLFLRRYEVSGAGRKRGPFVGDISRLISQLWTTGQDENSYANLSFISFQGLRANDESNTLPLVLPVGEVERVFRDPVLDGQFRLQASTANLRRDLSREASRVSAGGKWRLDRVVGPGLMVSPFAEARTDVYRVKNPGANLDETFARSVGLAGVEVRMPFVRPIAKGMNLMVEPIAMAALGSNGGNDPRIPNEDSQAFELDENNLFRPNAAPNYDLWEPGGRVSLGVRATAVLDDNSRASVAFGRRWRSKADSAFSPNTNLNGRASDYVGSVAASFEHFGGEVRFRLEDETLELNRLDSTLYGRLGPVSANLRYFNVDQSLSSLGADEQVSADVDVQVRRGWRVGASLRRDLDSDINLSQIARLTYQDNCTFVEFSYQRQEIQDRRLGPNEGFQIRIGLTTLGMAGGDD
jgi:LPS-assembly protein